MWYGLRGRRCKNGRAVGGAATVCATAHVYFILFVFTIKLIARQSSGEENFVSVINVNEKKPSASTTSSSLRDTLHSNAGIYIMHGSCTCYKNVC